MNSDACSTECACVAEAERHEHQVLNDIGVDDLLTIPDDSSRKVTDSTSTKHRCKHRNRKIKFGGFYRHGKK